MWTRPEREEDSPPVRTTYKSEKKKKKKDLAKSLKLLFELKKKERKEGRERGDLMVFSLKF